MTPTKEDHRVAIQCMNARYAEEAAEIVAEYRRWMVQLVVDSIQPNSSRASGVENPNAEQVRNPDKLA